LFVNGWNTIDITISTDSIEQIECKIVSELEVII